MRNIFITAIVSILFTIGANGTVLFPHFVDIAPNYERGVTEELEEAGVKSALYHSTAPGFMTSNYTEVESFFKDTLPNDVVRTETEVGDRLLVTYTSINKKDDTIKTGDLKCTIYVLRRPDDSFVAGYSEVEIEKEN